MIMMRWMLCESTIVVDMVYTAKPDERAVMTYVSCYYHALQGAQHVSQDWVNEPVWDVSINLHHLFHVNTSMPADKQRSSWRPISGKRSKFWPSSGWKSLAQPHVRWRELSRHVTNLKNVHASINGLDSAMDPLWSDHPDLIKRPAASNHRTSTNPLEYAPSCAAAVLACLLCFT